MACRPYPWARLGPPKDARSRRLISPPHRLRGRPGGAAPVAEDLLQSHWARPILAIARRELASAFDSPLAWIAIPGFLLMVAGASLGLQDVLAEGVASLRTVFFWCGASLLLLVPALTMRSFAEERRTGSFEVLATLPVQEDQLVLGKYLAALVLVSLALALTLPYPLVLSRLGALDWGPVLSGYLGVFLLAAGFCAIGVAASAWTSNAVVAYLLALLLGLLPFATGHALGRVPAAILPLVQHLSFETHQAELGRGVVAARNLLFHGSLVALFLHLAVFHLQRRRLS